MRNPSEPMRPGPLLWNGTSWAAVRQAASVVTYLAVTPVLVRELGLQRFGAWALVGGLAGYGALADLGLRAAMVKLVAEQDARHDRAALDGLAGSCIALGALLAVSAAGAILWGGSLFLAWSRIPPSLQPEVSRLLDVTAIHVAVALWMQLAASWLEGLQRLRLVNGVLASHAVMCGAGLWLAVVSSGDLAHMASVQLAVSSATLVFLVAATWHQLGRRYGRLRPRLESRSMRSCLGYGLPVLGSSIAHLGNLHFEKLLLGRWVGLEAASVYELSLRVALGLRLLPALLLSAVVPVVSHLWTTARIDAVRAIYNRCARYVGATSVFLAAFALVFMPALLEAWLGRVDPRAVLAARVLSAAHLANAFLGVPLFLARGLGRLHVEAQTAFGHVVLQCCLGFALVPLLGLDGALVSASATLLCITVFGLGHAHRRLGLLQEPAASFFARHLRLPVGAALVAAAATAVARAAYPPSWIRGPELLWIEVPVFTVTFVLLALAGGAPDAHERTILSRYVLRRPECSAR